MAVAIKSRTIKAAKEGVSGGGERIVLGSRTKLACRSYADVTWRMRKTTTRRSALRDESRQKITVQANAAR
jgi:hypothetical protein